MDNYLTNSSFEFVQYNALLHDFNQILTIAKKSLVLPFRRQHILITTLPKCRFRILDWPSLNVSYGSAVVP